MTMRIHNLQDYRYVLCFICCYLLPQITINLLQDNVRSLKYKQVVIWTSRRENKTISNCFADQISDRITVLNNMHTLRLLWAAHNEEVWLRRQRRNVSRRCLAQISEMPDAIFIEKFRLNKETFRELCKDFRTHTSLRGTKEIPLEMKILCALSFLATGSYQRIVGVTQQLPQRTASRCIRQVVAALNNDYFSHKYIRFPQTQQERSSISQEFERQYHLPGVIGCVDCVHISIIKPDRDEHLFLNKKGYHSLNVQIICDHNLKILEVNPKYGGDTQDCIIWLSSQVEPYMREVHRAGEKTWLLGDSEYPQRAWLMTPILNASPNSQEEVYNQRHTLARNCIKRCFGLLKARWRCLLKERSLHYHPTVASEIIIACCVLHNISLEADLPPIDLAELSDDGDDVDAKADVSESSDQDDLEDDLYGKATLSTLVSKM